MDENFEKLLKFFYQTEKDENLKNISRLFKLSELSKIQHIFKILNANNMQKI